MRPTLSFENGRMQVSLPCPHCKGNAQRTKVSVQETSPQNDRTVLHVYCPKCRAGFLASVMIQGQSLACMILLSDLSAEEAKRHAKAGPIPVEAVMDVGEALERLGMVKPSPTNA